LNKQYSLYSIFIASVFLKDRFTIFCVLLTLYLMGCTTQEHLDFLVTYVT